MSTLNIYSFLCKLQTHNKKSYFGFDLGNCGNIFTYIPRIEFKNIILSLATWNLSKKHFIEIIEANSINNFEEANSLFSDFRKNYKIPTKVLLADGDNLLYFNFANELSLKVFLDEIKNRDSFTLKEFIIDESSDIVNSSNGNYCHQIIASYIKENKSQNSEQIATPINEDIPKRQFVAGSDWLYYKIYCGAKIADNFLSEELKRITEALQASNLIKKWFFIRYSDNQGLHLRIRFEIANEDAITTISNQILNATKKYIDEGLIHKIQLDTYDREIERYGKSTMALSETFFFLDSQNILNFIDLIEGDEGELYRWLFALKNTDAIFESFNMTLDEKIKFTAKNAAGFLSEFGGSKFTKEEINKKYRDNKELIIGFMENSNEVDDWQIIFDEINSAKNLRIDLCTKIKEEIEKNKELPFDYILGSFVHMSINRLFRSKQRKNEMVIYDFLNKYYLWKANTQKK
jgi:thiopeptide-type bacteriocin biosynthesis protein